MNSEFFEIATVKVLLMEGEVGYGGWLTAMSCRGSSDVIDPFER